MKLFNGIILLLLTASTLELKAQDSSSSFNLKGFMDVYYAWDIDQPVNHERPDIFYNHKRHNEFNLNLGLVHLNYTKARYTANFGIMAGNYPQYNLAHEPSMLQYVYEANVGIALDKKGKFSIDAGILPSYIGFESAISADNYTLTRSLIAENSPYYFAGTQLNWKVNSKISVAALILNGWQTINRPDGHQKPSYGTQLKIEPTKNLTLNWSAFYGSVYPDNEGRTRIFNDLFLQYETQKFGFIAACDIGYEKVGKNSNLWYQWIIPTLITRYQADSNWAAAFRLEYVKDPGGAITGNINGFNGFGGSVNVDYSISEAVLFRVEGRYLYEKSQYFITPQRNRFDNLFIIVSLAVKMGNWKDD